MNQLQYSLRPIRLGEGENDLPFLRDLYASTRWEEVRAAGWPEDQMRAFLQQQFEAQHTHYQKYDPTADFDLILSETGEAIGRLYLDEREKEFQIIDIALLPDWRGRGLGTTILHEIMERASALDKAVSIYVEFNNPAMSLYRRLGFELVEDTGLHHLMSRSPGAVSGTAEW